MEVGFRWISLPRPAYPPSSFLHPSAIAPSCGIPRCLGSPPAGWRLLLLLPLCSSSGKSPLSSGQSCLCLLGRPSSHLSCIQLPGFTCGLALSHVSKWTNGGWQEEGWGGDVTGRLCEHTRYISWGNQVKKELLLARALCKRIPYEKWCVWLGSRASGYLYCYLTSLSSRVSLGASLAAPSSLWSTPP